MDPVQCKGSFAWDAFCLAEVNSCLLSQGEKSQPAAWEHNPERKYWRNRAVVTLCLTLPPVGLSFCEATYFWLEIIRFVTRSAFFICDAMDQMADEMTLRAEVKDKGRANDSEESSTWARGGKLMWLTSVESNLRIESFCCGKSLW